MTRRLKVCIVNPFGFELFDPDARASNVFGGAEVQLYYLATALAEDNRFEVSMIVEQPHTPLPHEREGVRMIGVKVMPSRWARFRDRVPVPSGAYFAAMRTANADIYLQRGGAVLTGDVALFCKLARRKFAFMAAHDWDCDMTHRRGRQYLAGAYYLGGLRRAHHVFAQSGDQSLALSKHHGIASTLQRTVYPAPADLDTNRAHVLWIGRCVIWKQPHEFLELAERLPDVSFVMICPLYEGARELHDQVQRRARSLANVRFIDFVPFEETEGWFARAIAFVNTSTHEGFPNTFVQAARTATPILSLHVDPDAMLEAADIGACAGGDTDRLAELLQGLVDQGGTWSSQSANAYSYFCREHERTLHIKPFSDTLATLK